MITAVGLNFSCILPQASKLRSFLLLLTSEVVGALASVFVIWILTGILVYKAVERVQSGSHHDIDAKVMLITAGLGVAVNIM